jgi:hypothetical protein
MRNLKKYLAVALTIAMMTLAIAPVAVFANSEYSDEAQSLYELGLYKGLSENEFVPDLDSTLDRQTGAVMLLRMFGLEEEALLLSYDEARAILAQKFSDANEVAEWAVRQVAYATEQGVIAGFPGGTFGPTLLLTGRQYLALTLNMLGYDQELRDRGFDASGELFYEVSEITISQELSFDQPNAIQKSVLVGISFEALKSNLADGSGTLAEKLVREGVLAPEAAQSAGVYVAPVAPVEPSEPEEPSEPVLEVHEVSVVTEDGVTTVEAHVSNYEEGDTAIVALTPAEELELGVLYFRDVEIGEEGKVSYTFDFPLPAGTHSVAVWVGEVYSEVEFTIEAPEVGELSVEVSASNARTLKVEFNQAIEDVNEVTFHVERDGFRLNIQDIEFNAAKTVAELVFPNRFVEGTHKVHVKVGEVELDEVTLELGDEVVAEIEFENSYAILQNTAGTDVRVYFKVYNQYGEDITETASLEVSVSSSYTATIEDNYVEVVTTGEFEEEDRLTVSLLDAESGTFASASFVVAEIARAASFELLGLYNEDGLNPRVGDEKDDFYILFKAFDQYGNHIKQSEFDLDDVSITVSNTSVLDVVKNSTTEETVDDVDYIKLSLVTTPDTFENEGKSRVSIISLLNGERVQLEIEVLRSLEVETLTLSTPSIAVAGEDIVIPFTALDQNGEVVRDLDKFENVEWTLTGLSGVTGADVAFKRDLETGSIKLVIDAADATETANRTVTLTATTDSGNVTQRSFTVRPNAEPKVVVGLDAEVERNIYLGQEVEIDFEDILVNDQYGRLYEIDSTGIYRIVVESSSETRVELSGGTQIVEDKEYAIEFGQAVTLTGESRGSSTIKLTLQENDGGWKDVASSSWTYTARVYDEDDITSYELGTLPLLYTEEDGSHDAELDVYGLVGTQKVQIPSTLVTFTGSSYIQEPSLGYVRARKNGETWDPDTTKQAPYTVIVVDKDGNTVFLNGVALVSNAEPKIDDISIADTDLRVSSTVVKWPVGWTNGSTETLRNKEIALEVLEFEDQYEVELTIEDLDEYASIVRSNIEKDDEDGAYADGDSFKLTVVAKSGVVFAFTVEVVANNDDDVVSYIDAETAVNEALAATVALFVEDTAPADDEDIEDLELAVGVGATEVAAARELYEDAVVAVGTLPEGSAARISLTATLTAIDAHLDHAEAIIAAVAAAKTALTALAFDVVNNAVAATPEILKPADHANGATYTLAVGNLDGNDDNGNAVVGIAGDVEITRDGTNPFTFDITVTITKGGASDTKVFNVSVPTGVGEVTVVVAP